MNEQDPKEPGLRVVPEDVETARLNPEKPIHGGNSKPVKVLRPDLEARRSAKTFVPEVAEILDNENEEIDSEEAWGAAARKAPPLGWFVLAGIVVCGFALWASVNVFRAQSELAEVEEDKKELIVDRIKEDKEVRQTLDLMKDCVRGYLMAKSIEEKLPYIRHADRVKPMMVNYYQTNEMKPADFRNFERIRSMGLESLSFVFGQVELYNGKKHRLLLEQLEDGTFKVDWESDVCYLPIPWGKYLQESPPEPVIMRVFIKRDHFYSYEFRDETLFDSYKLTTRDADDHIFGFVEKGSKVAMDINRFLKKVEEHGRGKSEPLMLRLRFPENSNSKKCVWIDELIAPRWTYVKSPKKEAEAGK